MHTSLADRDDNLSNIVETPSILNIRAIAFFLPVALFIFALSFVPLPAELTSYNPLTSTVARLVVLGTIILGLLSGLGAVNGAWGTFACKAAVPSATSIASAENALERVRSDLRERTHDLDAYSALKPQGDGSWLSRVTSKRDAREISYLLDYPSMMCSSSSLSPPDQGSLQQEIIGLQALESQMTTRVAALKRHHDDTQYALSIRGKILSRVWAVYCVCRVFSASTHTTRTDVSLMRPCHQSVINLLSPPSSIDDKTSSYGDIIAHIFAYLFSLLPAASGKPSINVPSLSRQISLALVGAIILSSVRVVLRGVTRVCISNYISQYHGSLMLLLLAQLMGIYLLSTLVQLRTMFPPSPSSFEGGNDGDVNLFSSLPQYSLFGGLFDWTFLFGAVGCILARWAGRLFNGDDDDYT
ncbi:Abscisic acid G-protein coupled receptor-domain-containing protein [Chiua virens]|nr:Abscisic acid G-protein coupled receptor-domain-containing protein [Chiua virens]